MSLRREAALLLAVAAGSFACAPEVTQDAPKQEIVFAAFASPNIPLPNDLALATVPTDGALVNTAQLELLNAFVTAGGFPSDQEVAVTIPFRRVVWNPSTLSYEPGAPPAIDLATVSTDTIRIYKVDGGTPVAQDYEVASYLNGTLTLRKVAVAGSRRWAPGRYVVAVRGGTFGVKTTSGATISADQAIELVKPNRPLGVRENQPVGGLSAAQVTQLETIRAALWNPLDWDDANAAGAGGWAPGVDTSIVPAFTAATERFPLADLIAVSTFEVAPATTSLLTDSGSGTMPLPSDFLLVIGNPAGCPSNATNPLQCVRNLSAFGPAAEGIATLDGFSTTAPLLIPTTAPVTVPAAQSAVFVIDVTNPAAPVPLRDVVTALGAGQPSTARFATGASGPSLALQIASPLTVPGPSGPIVINLPPLAEKRIYAVVVTNRVRDAAGNPIVRSTLGKILWGFSSPLFDGTNSLIPGVAASDAAGLQFLRNSLNPLLAALPILTGDSTVTRDAVVMAYTVHTLTNTEASTDLAAAPYGIEQVAGAVFAVTGAGTTPTLPGTFPNVAAFREFPMNTLFAIDLVTGAIDRDEIENPVPVSIPVLVSFPAASAVPACPGNPAALCAPVVLFHHGLGGDRRSMLAVADRFAQAGMVVAAIDAPYHGFRGFCQENTDCGAADGVCDHPNGIKEIPGTCAVGTLQSPVPRYFISSNFFRTRDAIRHTTLDYSALALAVARPPAPYPQPLANPVADTAAALGYAIDPTQVHFAGVSLGGIIGTTITATNPRVQRAVLNVPGATMFDVFTKSPEFESQVDPLLASIVPRYTRARVTPGDPAFDPVVFAAFTQASAVAKWILDPADPLNFASHVEDKIADQDVLAALGPTATATAQVYAQMVVGDQVILNPFSDLLFSQYGAGVDQVVYSSAATPAAQLHGLIGVPSAQGATVRDHAATFLTTGTAPATGAVNLDP